MSRVARFGLVGDRAIKDQAPRFICTPEWIDLERRPAVSCKHPPFIMVLLAAALASGCMAPPSQPTAPPPTPQGQAVSAPPAQSGASALSYGSVTSTVIRGKTTQADLLQMFGGPNISTVDSQGLETWVYERSVSQTDVSSKNQNWQAAANLGAAFGNFQAGASASGGQGSAAATTATSFRSLTVIAKFNADKTVKDYSVRASQF
jgi:hypothetical protein